MSTKPLFSLVHKRNVYVLIKEIPLVILKEILYFVSSGEEALNEYLKTKVITVEY